MSEVSEGFKWHVDSKTENLVFEFSDGTIKEVDLVLIPLVEPIIKLIKEYKQKSI